MANHDDPVAVRRRVLEYALGMPGAHEDHPWGETVAKVDNKVFLFGGTEGAPGSEATVGLKLNLSHEEALGVDGVAQMRYGLGRSGWVTIRVAESALPPEVLEDWIEESYRLVATKRRVAELDARHETTAD
jgi:predicted DNA-binding protein (MmcQ/YjbR family)